MKCRKGFVSNSSSTCFIITNKTDKDLDLVEFVKENIHLIDLWHEEYGEDDNQFGDLLHSAEENNEIIPPGANEMAFGDEDGTVIGRIFDYILRDGGESKSFTWRFKEYWR